MHIQDPSSQYGDDANLRAGHFHPFWSSCYGLPNNATTHLLNRETGELTKPLAAMLSCFTANWRFERFMHLSVVYGISLDILYIYLSIIYL